MNWGTSGVEKYGNRNRLDTKRFCETEGDKGGECVAGETGRAEKGK